MDDLADAGVEMTEEEWNLRVAELNKHQVCICKLNTVQYISRVKDKINQKIISVFPTLEPNIWFSPHLVLLHSKAHSLSTACRIGYKVH